MRFKFWSTIHRLLESAWHWVYFNKLRTIGDHMKHINAKRSAC